MLKYDKHDLIQTIRALNFPDRPSETTYQIYATKIDGIALLSLSQRFSGDVEEEAEDGSDE